MHDTEENLLSANGTMTSPSSAQAPSARVILLAGSSGSGKTTLSRRMGLPVVSLDDFYRDGALSNMPLLASGIVDWDDPRSWDQAEATAALSRLCRLGRVNLPRYSIRANRKIGTQIVDLGGSSLFIAEGVFASSLLPQLQERGFVAAAICLTRTPLRNFWFRLRRDVQEGRKPFLVALRRGLRLALHEPVQVRQCVRVGCQPAKTIPAAEAIIRAVTDTTGSSH